MEQTLRDLGLMKLGAITPRKPEDLIKGMIRTGDINLIGYYQDINITPLLSALTAAVTNGTTFAGQPSTTDSTVILLSKREPISFVAQSMKDHGVNMNRVVVPHPATECNLTVEYINSVLETAKDPALLIIDSLEDILKDEPVVLPTEAYDLLRKITNVCVAHNCALVVTSEIVDADEYELDEDMDDTEAMLHELLGYEPPVDCFSLTAFLKRLFIVGHMMPGEDFCLLEQPTKDPLAKLWAEFDIDENGKIVWKTEE